MIGIIGSGAGGVALSKYFEDRDTKTIVWFHFQDKYRLFKSQNKVIISKDITEDSKGTAVSPDTAERAGSADSTQYNGSQTKNREKKNNRETEKKTDRTTIFRITDSLEELIENARYIFIVTPARVHEEIAFQLEDLLDPNYHVLILYPGRTYGSLAFYNSMRFKFDNIFEAQTILHACRLENNNLIIRGKKQLVYYSTPFTASQEQLEFIEEIFPDLKFEEDYPGTTLNNMGALLHPIPLVLNGTRVESGEDFDFYSDGLTNKVIDYIYKVQAEKKAVMKKLNCDYIPLYRWLNLMYNVDGANLKKSVNKIKAYRGLAAPNTLNHRYIFDDIITGLVPLYYTASNLCLEADALGSFINFASNYMDKDFMQVGRRDLYSKYLSGDDNWLK